MIKTKTKRAKVGPIRADSLKSFVERIEKLEEERGSVGDDIKDVYGEAAGAGYDRKTIRWLIQERKMDTVDRDERDALRDTYAHALGMAVDLVRVEGLSQREAAKRAGVSKSSLNRALAVPEVSQGQSPHDADGVITETAELDTPPGDGGERADNEAASGAAVANIQESCGLCPVSAADGAAEGNGLPSAKGEAEHESPAARRHTSDDALAPALGISQCGDDAPPGPQEPLPVVAHEPKAMPRESLGAVARPSAAERVANPTLSNLETVHDDDLAFPLYLRRT